MDAVSQLLYLQLLHEQKAQARAIDRHPISGVHTIVRLVSTAALSAQPAELRRCGDTAVNSSTHWAAAAQCESRPE